MNTIKTTFSICLLLSLLSSCKKDYTCTCETTFDDSSHQTSVWLIDDVSKNSAEDLCDWENGLLHAFSRKMKAMSIFITLGKYK